MTTHDVALLEAIPGNKGPWRLPPVKTQTQVRPIDRLTKRITAASHFRAHFDTTTTTPNKILADLAKRVPRLKVSQISGGQWWSEKLKGKEFLHTTVKIPTNIADTIIRYSSTWGIFTCKLAFSVSGAMQTNRGPEWSGLSTPFHAMHGKPSRVRCQCQHVASVSVSKCKVCEPKFQSSTAGHCMPFRRNGARLKGMGVSRQAPFTKKIRQSIFSECNRAHRLMRSPSSNWNKSRHDWRNRTPQPITLSCTYNFRYIACTYPKTQRLVNLFTFNAKTMQIS